LPLKINLTTDRIRTLDPGDMLGKTLELPRQILRGLDLGLEFLKKYELKRPAALDWCGLGGSAVAGDLLQGFGFEPPMMPLRITVQRYPRESQALRLVSSYSGNTVESLHAFQSVPSSQIWLSMSSGGKLAELAHAAGVAHLTLPSGYPPRAAVGFGLGAMMAIFDQVYDLKIRTEIRKSCEALESIAESYRNLDREQNPALALAIRLTDKTPVIYTLDGLSMPAQAVRFCAQLAENAKVWSHWAPLPEMAHNEVESFPALGQALPPPLVIFIGSWGFSGRFTDPRVGIGKILDSLQIAHMNLDPAVIWPEQTSRLSIGLRMMLLLDAAAINLALLRAVNPAEIPILTELKNYRPTA
jgi:glucose/mannose-6-phosphate isomerase